MSAARRFRVFVHEWTCWDTYITADSAEAAEAEAERLWLEEGPDAFSLHDSGTDEIHAEESAS
jgi:hypothetical protein